MTAPGARSGRLIDRPALWILIHAALIVALASRLPADAWFVGDPGVKLIAARSALAHPARPFETELPPVPAEVAGDYLQPFFVPHGDHAHAFTSQLLPLLTAPFLALFGLRGAYVLPALGWLLTVPLTAQLARAMGARASPALLMLCGIAATPLVFYGLEFWEHAPALAAIVGSACLAFAPTPPSAGRAMAAGAISGLAILLRPEAAWCVVPLAIVLFLQHRSVRRIAAFGSGAVLALLPIAAYNVLHFGNLAGPHVAGNVAMLSQDWMVERVAFFWTWLGPTRTSTWSLWGGLVAAHLLARVDPGWGLAGALSRLVSEIAGFVAVILLLFEMGAGHEIRENLWRVFPLGVLALLPGVASTVPRHRLELLVAIPLLGVLLTAPNDGGGQWGPRYLLPIVPFLAILAIDALGALGPQRSRVVVLLGAIGVLAGLAASRSAWLELSGSKQAYAQLVHETAAELPDVSYVVTDVWWFGQMHAAILGPQQVLHVEPDRAPGALAHFGDRDVLLVRAADATTPVAVWTRGTCYIPRAQRAGTDGRLIYTRLSCR
jgi:hypothetical protein